MPIVAMCPYCREGGVRAPNHAAGWTATCPKCKSSFTIVPPDPLCAATTGFAIAEAQASVVRTPTGRGDAAARHRRRRDRAIAGAAVGPTFGSAIGSARACPRLRARDIVRRVERSFPVRVVLVAATLFGVGLVASQFPYGRAIGLGVCGIGLVLGLLCLLAEGRTRIVAGAAAGLNLLALVLLLFAPSWLGLTPWQSETDPSDQKTVLAIGRDGQSRTPADWVDASIASWAFGDIQVTIRSAATGPIELTGPNGLKKITKESYLQIFVEVANVGVDAGLSYRDGRRGRPVTCD